MLSLSLDLLKLIGTWDNFYHKKKERTVFFFKEERYEEWTTILLFQIRSWILLYPLSEDKLAASLTCQKPLGPFWWHVKYTYKKSSHPRCYNDIDIYYLNVVYRKEL